MLSIIIKMYWKCDIEMYKKKTCYKSKTYCWNDAFWSAVWDNPEVEFAVESWVDMMNLI